MSDTATSLVPYLTCDPAREAIAFYAAAFGAEEVGARYEEDGKIGHVELSIGGARLFLSDEYPELGLRSPHALPARSSSLVLFSDSGRRALRPRRRARSHRRPAAVGRVARPRRHRHRSLRAPLDDSRQRAGSLTAARRALSRPLPRRRPRRATADAPVPGRGSASRRHGGRRRKCRGRPSRPRDRARPPRRSCS